MSAGSFLGLCLVSSNLLSWRPNILLITTDQQRADTVAAWQRATGAAPTAVSPHADALAASGVLFTDAHTVSPVCSPARTSLLLGVTPFVHGTLENGIDGRFANVSDSWPTLLRRRGYSTAVFGKLDFGEGPVGMRVREGGGRGGGGGPSGGFETVDPHSGNLDMRGKGRSTSNFLETVLVDRTIKWIGSAATWSRKRRFAVHTSFVSPHVPTATPEGPWNKVYDGRPLPQPHIDESEQSLTKQDRWMNGEEESNRVPEGARRQYYALAAYVDVQLGRLVSFVRSSGLQNSTLIVFTSDHGCLLGDHGISEKHAFYDGALRVPLVLSLPGVLPQGAVSRGLASTLDVTATLVAASWGFDAAGRSPPEHQGFDLVAPLATGGASPRPAALVATLYTAFALVTPRWKLAYYPEAGEGRLWDRVADPLERTDLFGSSGSSNATVLAPGVRAVRDGLLTALLRWRSMQLPLRFMRTSARPRASVGTRVARHAQTLRMIDVERTLQTDVLKVTHEGTPPGTSARSDGAAATRSAGTAVDASGSKDDSTTGRPLRGAAGAAAITHAVVIIGEQKSGTTMLDVLLRRLVARKTMKRKKELHIFDFWHGCGSRATAASCHREMAPYVTDDGWYVDSTPAYFASAIALTQITASLESPRLILMLRDPLERAHSAWLQNREDSDLFKSFEPRSFDEAVLQELHALHGRCFSRGWVPRNATAAIAAARAVAESLMPWEVRRPRDEMRGGSDQVFGDLDADPEMARSLTSTACRPSPQSCWLLSISRDPLLPKDCDKDCKSYLSRGLQAAKLRVWLARFPSLLVLRLEEVTARGLAETLVPLARHIGVADPTPSWLGAQAKVLNQSHWHVHKSHSGGTSAAATATNKKMTVETSRILHAFYDDDQRQLETILAGRSRL